jgi:ribose-phosphate pyrophosphokinase
MLVTVDPHLHRHPALSALYTILAETLHVSPLLADWITADVDQPLVIDPDGECKRRVSAIAGRGGHHRRPRFQSSRRA